MLEYSILTELKFRDDVFQTIQNRDVLSEPTRTYLRRVWKISCRSWGSGWIRDSCSKIK